MNSVNVNEGGKAAVIIPKSTTRTKVRKAAKAIAFTSILLCLISVTSHILSRPHGEYWATETGMDLVRRFRGQYDVVFAGTSVVIANISCKVLYDEYGIKSVSVGEPEQPLFLTKYTIEELLRYQHPKAILVDAKSFFYEDKRVINAFNENEEYYLHNTLDSIHSPFIKRRALRQVSKYKEGVDEKEYYFRLYNRHSQWKNLTEFSFQGNMEPSTMNGNIMLTDITDKEEFKRFKGEFSEESQKEVLRIKEMCEKAGTDLILMFSYASLKSNRNQVHWFAEENQLDLIDFNEVMDEIGFVHEMYNDAVHFNIAGTTVWSKYIGKYLTGKYSFEPASPKLDTLYKDQSETYADYMNCVSNKLRYAKNMNFKEFLKEYLQADMQNTSMFAAVNDDACGALDEEDIELLHQIGLDGPRYFRGSFAAAYVTDGVIQDNSEAEKISLSGTDGVLAYSIESAGGNCEGGPGASIFVNGEEFAKGSRGINIVLFDNKLGKLITSKCFDTCAVADPRES